MTIIEFKHISYQVKEKQILHDVSFKVDRGDFLTLVGPSGSGKSTILKLTANLISPTAGDIFIKTKRWRNTIPSNTAGKSLIVSSSRACLAKR